jgi:hypothetical protein
MSLLGGRRDPRMAGATHFLRPGWAGRGALVDRTSLKAIRKGERGRSERGGGNGAERLGPSGKGESAVGLRFIFSRIVASPLAEPARAGFAPASPNECHSIIPSPAFSTSASRAARRRRAGHPWLALSWDSHLDAIVRDESPLLLRRQGQPRRAVRFARRAEPVQFEEKVQYLLALRHPVGGDVYRLLRPFVRIPTKEIK